MSPTFEGLAFELSKRWDVSLWPCVTSKESDILAGQDIQLPLPRLLDPDKPCPEDKADALIIADTQQLETHGAYEGCFEHASIICCNGSLPEHYKKRGCKAICIDGPDASVIAVHNCIQEIFGLYQQWEATLQDILANTVRVQDILDAGISLLQNTVYVVDENNNLLAGSGHTGKSNHVNMHHRDKQSATGDIHPSIKTIGDGYIDVGDHTYTYAIELSEAGSDSNSYPAELRVRIQIDKAHAYTLGMIADDHRLQASDRQLLEVLARYVLIQLLRPYQLEDERIKQILVRLLKGERADPTEATLLQDLLALKPGRQLICVVIHVPAEAITQSGTYLRRRINLITPAALAVIYDEAVVGVINTTESNWNPDEFYAAIKDCLGWLEFTIGASDEFISLTDLAAHYRQALMIARAADPAQERVHTMDDYDCWNKIVLRGCCAGLPAQMLLPTSLKRLIAYNDMSDVDYLETLRAYLEERCNDSRTARRLFISRNSFLFRLQKIREVTGCDLDSPDTRFQLELCLRLLGPIHDNY